jgi:riboflavin kinase/FMN adenylyltransferase
MLPFWEIRKNLSIKVRKLNHNQTSYPRALLILLTYFVVMIIHEGYENLNLVNPVVTLGIFDGVHRGHRALLDKLVSYAGREKGVSVVVTFFPHPRMVLDSKTSNLLFLSTMEEKIDLLKRANIDHLIIIGFNKKFSRITACDFVKNVLSGKIGTKHIVIGYNHHFGRKGEGDYDTLKRCTESSDFVVEQVRGFSTENGIVSSSLIREALLNGKLDEANNWLGYAYSLTGTVIGGSQVGRSIGFPTANIKPLDPHKLIPLNGVYAVEVKFNNLTYPGMLSIGSNPTVNKNPDKRFIEVNILNFEGDLYDKEISVVFKKRLRDELKFESIVQLAEQIKTDRERVLDLLT